MEVLSPFTIFWVNELVKPIQSINKCIKSGHKALNNAFKKTVYSLLKRWYLKLHILYSLRASSQFRGVTRSQAWATRERKRESKRPWNISWSLTSTSGPEIVKSAFPVKALLTSCNLAKAIPRTSVLLNYVRLDHVFYNN